jgi:hypothetical protein
MSRFHESETSAALVDIVDLAGLTRASVSEDVLTEMRWSGESSLTYDHQPCDGLLAIMQRIGEDWIRADTAIPGEHLVPESSTAQKRQPARVEESVQAAFRAAEDEVFEDGADSVFSEELSRLVRRYGAVSVSVVAHLLSSPRTNVEVAAQALRSLAEIKHSASHDQRLWLLETGLEHASSWVRDGAALGLASLDDPAAIRALEEAIEREEVEELRQDMEKVLAGLARDR